MEPEFCIVRIDRARFFKGFDGQHVDVTDVPSYGQLMTYAAATSWVARLRRRGFPESVICRADGELLTFERLQDMRRSIREEAASLPSTREELDKIPADEQRRRYATDASFATRMEELEAQPRTAPGKAK